MLIVGQVADIGALPITAARASRLPGRLPARTVDAQGRRLHPGEAKTDVRDVFVIVETARTMSHPLRAIDREDERPTERTMLTGTTTTRPARSTALPTGRAAEPLRPRANSDSCAHAGLQVSPSRPLRHVPPSHLLTAGSRRSRFLAPPEVHRLTTR
ncbi:MULTISPECIES: IS110 family transposase [Streptomyces]|uniref:IS110 family transposase n=1 Tax=Streptomyces TaxID=1883 RepID=UPI003B637494